MGYITEPIGHMSLGVKIGENYTDYSQGSFKSTGNTYDLAIEGNGFSLYHSQTKMASSPLSIPGTVNLQ